MQVTCGALVSARKIEKSCNSAPSQQRWIQGQSTKKGAALLEKLDELSATMDRGLIAIWSNQIIGTPLAARFPASKKS